MARAPLLVGLDAGTTSVRSGLFDLDGREVASVAARQRTTCPHPGWVEQDAEEVARLALQTLRRLLRHPRARRGEVLALGVTNQRESVVALDARTGRALAPIIVWQDTRTAELARQLGKRGWAERVWDHGGLPLTTYPSATKMRWLLENSPSVRRAYARDRLWLGTVDSLLLCRLTGDRSGPGPWMTDATNASRTLLYDLEEARWSKPLLDHFGVTAGVLPEIRPSFGVPLGTIAGGSGPLEGLPVGADLGDQQAGLIGVGGLRPGAAKLTLGTGAFFLAPGAPRGTGRSQGLIRTIVHEDGAGNRAFGLEGGVGSAGSFLESLGPSGLGLFRDLAEIERLAGRATGASGIHFVPAHGGLFAPHWDTGARGALVGLTRATERADVAHAAFEGIAHRVADILEAYARATGRSPSTVWVDGGLSSSSHLLQRIADLSGVALLRSPVTEATSRGAALAAGISVGLFSGGRALPLPEARRCRRVTPRLGRGRREEARTSWRSAVSRVRTGPQ